MCHLSGKNVFFVCSDRRTDRRTGSLVSLSICLSTFNLPANTLCLFNLITIIFCDVLFCCSCYCCNPSTFATYCVLFVGGFFKRIACLSLDYLIIFHSLLTSRKFCIVSYRRVVATAFTVGELLNKIGK